MLRLELSSCLTTPLHLVNHDYLVTLTELLSVWHGRFTGAQLPLTSLLTHDLGVLTRSMTHRELLFSGCTVAAFSTYRWDCALRLGWEHVFGV